MTDSKVHIDVLVEETIALTKSISVQSPPPPPPRGGAGLSNDCGGRVAPARFYRSVGAPVRYFRSGLAKCRAARKPPLSRARAPWGRLLRHPAIGPRGRRHPKSKSVKRLWLPSQFRIFRVRPIASSDRLIAPLKSAREPTLRAGFP